jgi:hypothetical protein
MPKLNNNLNIMLRILFIGYFNKNKIIIIKKSLANWPKRLDPHPWPNKERPGMHRLARPDSHPLLLLFIYFMFKDKRYFTKQL